MLDLQKTSYYATMPHHGTRTKIIRKQQTCMVIALQLWMMMLSLLALTKQTRALAFSYSSPPHLHHRRSPSSSFSFSLVRRTNNLPPCHTNARRVTVCSSQDQGYRTSSSSLWIKRCKEEEEEEEEDPNTIIRNNRNAINGIEKFAKHLSKRFLTASALFIFLVTTTISISVDVKAVGGESNNGNIINYPPPIILQTNMKRSLANAAAAVPAAAAAAAAPVVLESLTDAQQFVSNVWFAVTAQYFDPTFHGMGQEGWNIQKQKAMAALTGTKPLDRNVVNAVIDDMLASLQDPYTRFLRPDEFQAMIAYTKGGGDTGSSSSSSSSIDKNADNDGVASIGVQLLLDNTSGQVTVVNTVPNGPAKLGGVHVGDMVLEVDGINVQGASAEFVAAKCRGPVESNVELVVVARQQRMDAAGNKQADRKRQRLVLTRAKLNTIPSVQSSSFISQYSGVNLGLLRVSSFSQSTIQDLVQGLQDIRQQQQGSKEIGAIVIDIRGNVGGYMPAGIDAARMFLPAKAAVVAEIGGSGAGTFYFGKAGMAGADTVTTMYVLVDSRTASAAEIFAAALKDNRRATLVGPSNTFGKGRIQNIQSLEDGRGGIAVTRERYLTPSGRDIHGIGIAPNKLSGACVPEATASVCLDGII